jgi:hypothetical protein
LNKQYSFYVIGYQWYLLLVLDSPDRLATSHQSICSPSFSASCPQTTQDISSSFLSSTFQERNRLVWPVAEEVVEEIDFDLKEVG